MSFDGLAPVLDGLKVRARHFHVGILCGTVQYGAATGMGFVHLLRAGSLEVRHPGVDAAVPPSLVLDRPSLLFYPRDCPHQFIPSRAQPPDLVCASLTFDLGVARPVVRALPPLIQLPLAELHSAQSVLDLLFAERESVGRGQPLLADRLLEVLVLQLLRWWLGHADHALAPGLLRGMAHPGIAQALAALHREPAQAWTVQSLARSAAMSRSTFAHAFLQAVGQPPGDYLADWRIGLARQQLAAGRPLKQVAGDVGYGSASALSRAFSAREGMSPRAWLQRQDSAGTAPPV